MPKMPSRKHAKRPKYEKPSKKIPEHALIAAAITGNMSSLFFTLPLELCKRIYDFVWQNTNTVAVSQVVCGVLIIMVMACIPA